jgi:16S rRNA C967 or C1407 C5-methylase (RsmB/RsmF family)
VDFNSEKYKNVRFIMADPSCSGSGMLNNMFFEKQEKDVERLLKLAKFQVNPE